MSCCGQKRHHWQSAAAPTATAPGALSATASSAPAAPTSTAPPAPAASQPPALENPVPIRYHGYHTRMIKGPFTGFLYLFSPTEPALMVDGRDAPALSLMPDLASAPPRP